MTISNMLLQKKGLNFDAENLALVQYFTAIKWNVEALFLHLIL